tara:strand:+ start:73 stop:180 length:108 start_codon:yes stop_codon:yes gene_type:complete
MIFGAGITAAVAKKPGDWIIAAGFQWFAEDIRGRL